MLKVSEVTDDKLTLVHVVHRLELNRISDVNVQLKTVDLLEKAVNAHSRLKPEKHENGSAPDPGKRRRTRPTGLNFDD
uniref:Uncharacterized protein n=1 Tax=Setaria digitata TaxID=48799 RepID=A0A915PN99_9BILA